MMEIFGFKVGGAALIALAAAALILGAAMMFSSAVTRIDGMIADARVEATKARDAFWQAEIARSNATVLEAKAAQLQVSMEADAKTRAQIDGLNETLKMMETANAALPDTSACGLGRGHVGLLPN